jgi:hypothetical protein
LMQGRRHAVTGQRAIFRGVLSLRCPAMECRAAGLTYNYQRHPRRGGYLRSCGCQPAGTARSCYHSRMSPGVASLPGFLSPSHHALFRAFPAACGVPGDSRRYCRSSRSRLSPRLFPCGMELFPNGAGALRGTYFPPRPFTASPCLCALGLIAQSNPRLPGTHQPLAWHGFPVTAPRLSGVSHRLSGVPYSFAFSRAVFPRIHRYTMPRTT